MYKLGIFEYMSHKQLSRSSLVFIELGSEYKIFKKETGNQV